MTGLSATAVVDAWESCQGRTRADVAVRLLLLAHPEVADADLSDLPVGRRDRLLLDLRQRVFGDTLELRTACPACTEQLELGATVDEFRRPYADSGWHEIDVDGEQIAYRLPTSHDLAAAAALPTGSERYEEIWRRCVRASSAGAVGPRVRAAVESAMRDHDEQAVCDIELTCPECEHEWVEAFDVVRVLWAEIDGIARRRLFDVHRLAEAYGWDEAAVLSLGPARLQFYLDQL